MKKIDEKYSNRIIEFKMKTSCLKNLEVSKKSPKFSDEELEKFRLDPTYNPKTGRRISENGPIYKQLKEELDKKDRINSTQNIPPRVIVKKLKPKELATKLQK